MSLEDISTTYPLEERIGHRDLYVERMDLRREYDKWVAGIPKKLSKSKVLLARKKSGKTAFIQRLFNRLWLDNGLVIPFYLEAPDRRLWFPQFALEYYRSFASQYISFLERDPGPVRSAGRTRSAGSRPVFCPWAGLPRPGWPCSENRVWAQPQS